ncbi:CopD family protein [Novosphingobium sp. BL-8H]|uniref:CopD family protein n=1 Tax=Novosphingobium sp. BL-8H TaxID=3127640 RepID=UPI0037566494
MENGALIAAPVVAARCVSYALMLAVAGVPFHALIDRRARFAASARAMLAAMAAGALAASLWWAVADVAAMVDMPLAQLGRQTFAAVIGATPLATVLTVRTVALFLLFAAIAFRPSPRWLAPPALIALASAAWTGHAGAGSAMLPMSDILHLGAAALWLGAMLAFLAAMFRKNAQDEVIRSLAAFARTGTIVVAVLFATGTANAWLISDGSLPSGPWPRLIAVKVALFLTMLGCAARNRWHLVPALAAGKPRAARRLSRSLMLETACAVTIVLVVAVAGQLDPHG